MTDKAGLPPQNPTAFDQHSMQNPAAGQTNYGFSNPNHPPTYAPPQQGQFFGQQQTTNNVVVTQVGGGGGNVYPPVHVPYDYTTQAWLVCLCCFWPTGLLAILKASESRDALARGDLAGAQTAANSARTMIRASLIVGICGLIAFGIIFGVLFGVVLTTTSQCCVNGYCYNC